MTLRTYRITVYHQISTLVEVQAENRSDAFEKASSALEELGIDPYEATLSIPFLEGDLYK